MATFISNHLEGREICCGLRINNMQQISPQDKSFYYHIFYLRYLNIYSKSGNKESSSAAAINDFFPSFLLSWVLFLFSESSHVLTTEIFENRYTATCYDLDVIISTILNEDLTTSLKFKECCIFLICQ